MFERFTRRARTAVEAAVQQASDERSREVRPEHLLGAVLADEQALAATVLAGLGASLPHVRAELDRQRSRFADGLDAEDAEALAAIGIDLDSVLARVDTPAGPRRRPRFARTSKKALQLSLREALALRHNYIGTEHLLLGLVRIEDRVVLDTLTASGVTPAGLREAVAAAVRRAG